MSNAYNVTSEASLYGECDDDSSVCDYGAIKMPKTKIKSVDVFSEQARNTLIRPVNVYNGIPRPRRQPRKLLVSTRNEGRQFENKKRLETKIDTLKDELIDINKFYKRNIFFGQDHTTESIKTPKYNRMTYELERFNKNAMIIFNHENFLSDPTRRGTNLDVAAIKNTFKRFRFEVTEETTHNNLTREELFYELKKFSKRDFKDHGCICVAILTHGQDHGYLKAFDTRYCERDVIACFDACINPTLVGKPIIFLIQACRGRFPAYAVKGPHEIAGPSQTVEFDAEFPIEKKYRPMDSDIIMFHSSFFGRASIRVVEEGTWFIQTLCKQMTLHASTDHLEKLFRRVRGIVAQMEYEGAKQMPVVTSTLLKKLYLKEISLRHSVVDSSLICD